MNRQLELINKLGLDENSKSNLLIALPNELFEKIVNLQTSKKLKPNHIGLVWTYIYLNTLMYRFSTYDNFPITISEMKELLGYSTSNQTIDYIFKRNGILDELGILESTRQYPIHSKFNYDSGTLEIIHSDDFGDEYRNLYFKSKGITKRMFCKRPIFSFQRDNYDSGTFYNFENTTTIDFKVFKYFMSHDELSVNEFYLYCFIKRGNDMFGSFKLSIENLTRYSGLSRTLLVNYLHTLKKFNIVKTISNMSDGVVFYVGNNLPKLKPNTLLINDFEDFTKSPIELPELRVLSTIKSSQIEAEIVQIY